MMLLVNSDIHFATQLYLDSHLICGLITMAMQRILEILLYGIYAVAYSMYSIKQLSVRDVVY
jgi:hypothetical protein